MGSNQIQAPKGTRDLYPADAAKRRFVTEAWRKVSVRHGFDEIDGPTFEHLALYTVKSGEGIVSELFSFRREGGEQDYALRPEFTPTLARMFAARAGALPRPTKWFMTGPFFRAERPQRGRLREFLQWNVDVLGDPSPQADAEVIACCVALLRDLGFTPEHLRVKVNHRDALAKWLVARGVEAPRHADLFKLLDQRGKLPPDQFVAGLAAFGFNAQQAEVFIKGVIRVEIPPGATSVEVAGERVTREQLGVQDHPEEPADLTFFSDAVRPLAVALANAGVLDWIDFDLSIVRGLAYYTGMVFEVHEATGAERAVAGGGRYDNLVELFGGPPTPAVGFGMGDVVLTLIMQDKGLMPDEAGVLERGGMRPDVFVISNGVPEAEAQLHPLVASLRAAGLHARHTSKATRNVGKLLKEAGDCRARHAVIIETGQSCTIKDMGTGEQRQLPLDQALGTLTSSR